MAIKAASDAVAVAVKKSLAAPNAYSAVEIRLVSGDVDAASMVEWNASSSCTWLVLGETSGTVASANPVAVMNVTALGSGQNDTSASGPLRSTITVSSRMRNQPGRSDLFELNTSSLVVAVEVTIEAAVFLNPSDVRVQKRSGDDLIHGSEVVAGDTLTVTAQAFDFERRPVTRATLQIPVALSCAETSLEFSTLKWKFGNTFVVELPSAWIEEPGEYVLWMNATADSSGVAPITFTVSSGNQTMYVGLGIAVLPLMMLVAFGVMLYKRRADAKHFFQSFLSFEGLIVFEVLSAPQLHTQPLPRDS